MKLTDLSSLLVNSGAISQLSNLETSRLDCHIFPFRYPNLFIIEGGRVRVYGQNNREGEIVNDVLLQSRWYTGTSEFPFNFSCDDERVLEIARNYELSTPEKRGHLAHIPQIWGFWFSTKVEPKTEAVRPGIQRILRASNKFEALIPFLTERGVENYQKAS